MCTDRKLENGKLVEWIYKVFSYFSGMGKFGIMLKKFKSEKKFQPLFLGKTLDDMFRMEEYLKTQNEFVDFTVVKPPELLDTTGLWDFETFEKNQ